MHDAYDNHANNEPMDLRTFDSYAFLDSLPNFERTVPQRVSPTPFKLDRIRTLLGNLGNPHHGLLCVHVAGSKGKGSTCEMIAAGLQGCGYTVGVFTSPHLVSPRERVRINADPIPEPLFADVLCRVAVAADKHRITRGNSTYFEVMTAAGFVYFAEQAVDAAIIEVGLGGTLDSTNIITPAVCVIGAIQLEHTAILGATRAAIAGEKSGIMKPGTPVVTIDHDEEVVAVIREKADRAGAPLHILHRTLPFSSRVSADATGKPTGYVSVQHPSMSFDHVPVPLSGDHQAQNCGLALAAIALLHERGMRVSEPRVIEGLSRTLRHGRMELICGSPRVVIDGAHNPESIECLLRSIASEHTYDSLLVVFGCAKDKDVRGMLSQLAKAADKVLFTQALSPRSIDPRELLAMYAELTDRTALLAPTAEEAIHHAARLCSPSDLICVAGSFVLAGQVKAHVAARRTGANESR